jgi:DNA-3-methyladenine glycosylase II
MRGHTVDAEVLGPWSLRTSRAFWEGFSPSALSDQQAGDGIRTVFRVESDWSRAEVELTQRDHLATINVAGDGDLEAAADQVRRFLALDRSCVILAGCHRG